MREYFENILESSALNLGPHNEMEETNKPGINIREYHGKNWRLWIGVFMVCFYDGSLWDQGPGNSFKHQYVVAPAYKD